MPGEAQGAQGANGGEGGSELPGGGEAGKTFTAAEVEAQIAGLKAKNNELLGNIRQTKDQLKNFEGLDAAQAREALDQMAKMNEEKQRNAGKFDELKQQLLETHKRELTEREKKVERVTGKLYEYVGRNKALEAITKLEGNSTLLMPHIERHLRVIEDGDEFVPRIVDEKGKERLGPKGDPMTVEEFVTELSTKDAFAPAFKAPAVSGTGGRPGERPVARSGANIRMTREQAQDVHAYRRAKAEAEKAGGIVEIVG